MHILKDGRRAFLEFLRNLTPQAVVLALVFISILKLEEGKGSIPVLMLYAIIFTAAFYANASLFIEDAVKSYKPINNELSQLRGQGITNWRLTWRLIKFTWKNQKMFFVELLSIIVIVESGFAFVFITGITSADNFLQHL
jgi:hypothetical protein